MVAATVRAAMSNENLANKPFRPQMALFRPSPITIMIFPHQPFTNPHSPPKRIASLPLSHHLIRQLT